MISKILKEIKNLKDPYPEDIFPNLSLNLEQRTKLSKICFEELGFSLDRFSAELMRRGWNICKEDLLNKLEDLKCLE